MESTQTQLTLRELHIGSRLMIQSKADWRVAVISNFFEDKAVLIVCSPSGKTYRRSCAAETIVLFDGAIPLLGKGVWRENCVKYDTRW